MSPVNLGQLPSNQPAPTGLVQTKYGAASVAVAFDNMAPQGTIISDGNLQPMRIAITPSRPGWWVIRAETIWSIAEGNWYYGTWYVKLSPNDADGWASDYNHMSLHSVLGWQESCIDTVFRLNADVAYTAAMYWGYCNAGTWSQFCGGVYSYISGEFVGEGAL